MDFIDEVKVDITDIRSELDKRMNKIFEYANTIHDLKIEIKEKEIENIKLKKELNDLYYKLVPKHINK